MGLDWGDGDYARTAAVLAPAARTGGLVALTSWRPEGPIHAVGALLRGAFPEPPGTPARWGEIAVRADSPEAWLAEQEEHHPAWRWGRLTLGADAWAPLRERMVAALAEGNEDPGAFLTTSRYLVVRAAVLNRARGTGGPP